LDAPDQSKLEYRPLLNREISIADFKKHYWLKEELQDFCRNNGIGANGSKMAISERIERFLRSGEKELKSRKKPARRTFRAADEEVLSVNTIIPKDYTNNEKNRQFFKSIIGPQFHFTVRFMNFCKNNAGKTFQDAIDEWYAEQKEKKEGKYKTVIGPQFEYNRFIRDFYCKPENKGKKLKEAIAAWEESKRARGK
jgi:hypothetical protein